MKSKGKIKIGESGLAISEAFESMGVKLPKVEETTEETNNTDEYDLDTDIIDYGEPETKSTEGIESLDCEHGEDETDDKIIGYETIANDLGSTHNNFVIKDFETTEFIGNDTINTVLVDKADIRKYEPVKKCNIYGMCKNKIHCGLLTKSLMEQHECLRKQCRFFVKADNEYWRSKERQKRLRETAKEKEAARQVQLEKLDEIFKKFRYKVNLISAKLNLPFFVVNVEQNLETNLLTIKYADLYRDLRVSEVLEVTSEIKRELSGSGVKFETKAIVTPDGRLMDKHDLRFITDELINKIKHESGGVSFDTLGQEMRDILEEARTIVLRIKALETNVDTTFEKNDKPSVRRDKSQKMYKVHKVASRSEIEETPETPENEASVTEIPVNSEETQVENTVENNVENEVVQELLRRKANGEQWFYNLKILNPTREEIKVNEYVDKALKEKYGSDQLVLMRAVINRADKTKLTIYCVMSDSLETPADNSLKVNGFKTVKFVRMKLDKNNYVDIKDYLRFEELAQN